MIHPRRMMTSLLSRLDDSRNDMEALTAIGPVQLIVLGFAEPNFPARSSPSSTDSRRTTSSA